MIRLFTGYDAAEALAFSVFAHSVRRHASEPVMVAELRLEHLGGIFRRDRDPLQSTDFAFTRFLVPALCDYHGWALFCDGDMICRDDIATLWAMRNDRYAVMVVQHPFIATPLGKKFLDRPQTSYSRKNWSSVMLFNCARCRDLTPRYVETAPGLDLHQFEWARDYEIGALPKEWNHLVGVAAPNPDAKIVHYTLGMPFFSGYNECEFAAEWRAERDAMNAYQGRGSKCESR